jgi:hypothetical protein
MAIQISSHVLLLGHKYFFVAFLGSCCQFYIKDRSRMLPSKFTLIIHDLHIIWLYVTLAATQLLNY